MFVLSAGFECERYLLRVPRSSVLCAQLEANNRLALFRLERLAFHGRLCGRLVATGSDRSPKVIFEHETGRCEPLAEAAVSLVSAVHAIDRRVSFSSIDAFFDSAS